MTKEDLIREFECDISDVAICGIIEDCRKSVDEKSDAILNHVMDGLERSFDKLERDDKEKHEIVSALFYSPRNCLFYRMDGYSVIIEELKDRFHDKDDWFDAKDEAFAKEKCLVFESFTKEFITAFGDTQEFRWLKRWSESAMNALDHIA